MSSFPELFFFSCQKDIATVNSPILTHPKTNMSPKKGPFQKEVVFQPLFFRGHVSFLHEPPKPRFLEVFMVNNLVFRWPKPLFFMVLGEYSIFCREPEVSLFSAFSLTVIAGMDGSYWQCAILAITLWLPTFVWAYRYHCYLMNRKYVSCRFEI